MPDPLEQYPFSLEVDAQLIGSSLKARIVRLSLSEPTASVLSNENAYIIDMCLTPRPLAAVGNYRDHWGPHRYEKLGDIYIIPPGEALHVRGDVVRQATLMCDLSASAVSEAMGTELEWSQQKLNSTLDIGSARIRALLLRITDEVRHPGIASRRMIDLLASELAIEIGRYCLDQSEKPLTGGLSGWRLRLIDERLSESPEPPSLAELANLCGMSVRQLTRGFRVSRGCSIGDYLEQRRMEHSKRLLMQGEAVKGVAFALGFSSPSSFTFAFRRAVGMSPTQFRQRQARGMDAPR
ncbi:MAG: helix-turn-helix transcriptional regulator [Novosphingobium sp.]|nr:helix-turn-helix transcriptional regulator [Novosphingobium sp.]